MTQPTPYVRQFDFTNFSATYPTGQQPGVHMDAEWNAVGTTLTGVLTNLALIQRDDGALKNGSVGIDQFSSSALALIGSDAFIVAGQWVTGTAYALGSLITNGQTTCYLAIVAHTSTSISADLTDGKIVRIFDTSGSSGGTPDDDSVSTIKLQDGAVTAAKLASTTVTAGSFGSASAVATFTVDQDGRLTAAGNATIAINGSAVTGNISGNAANVTGIVSLANGGFGTSNASIAAARTTLGGTTVGVAVFTAVDAAAARTAIGAGTGDGDVTLNGVQTLTNKTLTLPVVASFSNSGTVTLPTGTRTLVARDTTDTLTNKTLTAPVISTIVNTGTITLPTATDTLVGRATTDTLTGKTMSGASNTFTNLPISALTGGPLAVGLGGTGGTSFTSGQYLKGAGTGTFTTAATIPSTDITGAVTMAARLTSSGVVVGSGTVDLATSGVSAGAYGSSTLIPIVTVDAYGRVTSVTTTGISGAAGGTVTSITAGTGLNGGTITGSGTIDLADTAVTPASYGSSTQIPIITIDQQGRITSASSTGVSGAAGGTVSLITNTGAGLTLTNAAGPTTNIDVDATVVAKLTATQTLTNKTMSGASNTFSNIPYTALTGNVTVGTGLTGGTLIGTGTISLANTAVSAGTYGIANTSIKATVDAQGRITSAADMPIAVTSIAAMVAIDKTTLANGQHLRVLGHTTAGDGGGGDFVWDDTSTATVNTGTCFQAAAGGAGRWLRVWQGQVGVKWFGAKGDGATNDTTAVQAAITYACANIRILFFPTGTYLVSALTIPSGYANRFHFVGDVGATLKASTASNTILTIAGDDSRDGSRRIENLRFDGNSLANVIGIDITDATYASLYVYLSNLRVTGCDIGIRTGNIQEHNWENIVCISNRVGIYAKSDSAGGGFSASIFTGLHMQSNRVGIVMFSNSVYPAGSHQFNSLLTQNNTLCGVAVIGDSVGAFSSMVFVNFYSEGNGVTSVNGDTETVDGLVIPRASYYSKYTNASIYGGEVGSGYATSFVLRNSSTLLVRDANIGGGSLQHVDADSSSAVLLEGTNLVTGSFQNVYDWDGLWYKGGGGGISSGTVLLEYTNALSNRYAGAGLFSDAPEAENAITAVPSKVYDSQHGYVQRVSFGGSIGNNSANRVTFTMMTDTTAVGDWVAVSFLAKANAPTTIAMYPVGAAQLSGPQTISLTTEWQRFVFYYSVATISTGGYLIYTYALDTSSPVVDFAKMMTGWVPAASNKFNLQNMIRRGYYNNTRVPMYAPAAPTTGTWAVGARVINSVPTVGQPKAWSCSTAGTPGTWTSEGNL